MNKDMVPVLDVSESTKRESKKPLFFEFLFILLSPLQLHNVWLIQILINFLN